MKANELMIGDWVVATEIGKPVQITAIADANVATSSSPYFALIDNIEPLLLTHQTLERNFPMQNPQIESKWVKWGDFNDPERGFYFEIDTPDNECDGPVLNMHFKYVHQLQHALKIVGIEKQIVL